MRPPRPRKSFIKRDQRGQALVELALVSLLFATIILGTFDVARMLMRIHQLTQAAREGARIASITRAPDTTAGRALVVTKIQRVLQDMNINSQNMVITITPLDLDGDAVLDVVDVTIAQIFSDAFGISAIPGLSNLPLTSTIAMPLFTR